MPWFCSSAGAWHRLHWASPFAGVGLFVCHNHISKLECFCSAGEYGCKRAPSFPRGAPHGLPWGRPSPATHSIRTTSSALRTFRASRASAVSSTFWYDDRTVLTGWESATFPVCLLLKFNSCYPGLCNERVKLRSQVHFHFSSGFRTCGAPHHLPHAEMGAVYREADMLPVQMCHEHLWPHTRLCDGENPLAL